MQIDLSPRLDFQFAFFNLQFEIPCPLRVSASPRFTDFNRRDVRKNKKSSRKAWVPGGQRTRVFSGSDCFEAFGRIHAAARARWSADASPLGALRPVQTHPSMDHEFFSGVPKFRLLGV